MQILQTWRTVPSSEKQSSRKHSLTSQFLPLTTRSAVLGTLRVAQPCPSALQLLPKMDTRFILLLCVLLAVTVMTYIICEMNSLCIKLLRSYQLLDLMNHIFELPRYSYYVMIRLPPMQPQSTGWR